MLESFEELYGPSVLYALRGMVLMPIGTRIKYLVRRFPDGIFLVVDLPTNVIPDNRLEERYFRAFNQEEIEYGSYDKEILNHFIGAYSNFGNNFWVYETTNVPSEVEKRATLQREGFV